jgi:hypothetical protein
MMMSSATAGADLDLNDSHHVTCSPSEIIGLLEWYHDWFDDDLCCSTFRWALDAIYRTVRENISVTYVITHGFFWDDVHIWGTPGNDRQGNDLAVSIRSAMGTEDYQAMLNRSRELESSSGKNHVTVTDAEVAELVVPWLRAAAKFGEHSDMRPWLFPLRYGTMAALPIF